MVGQKADLGNVENRDSEASPGPLTEAAEFFRKLLRLSIARNQHFGQVLPADAEWDVLVMLMLARLEQRDVSRDEAMQLWGASLQDGQQAVQRLEEMGLVEAYPDLSNPSRIQLTLSGETARRMVEVYRAQKAG
jgi:DNA-binding MarR family transcriptional regulator